MAFAPTPTGLNAALEQIYEAVDAGDKETAYKALQLYAVTWAAIPESQGVTVKSKFPDPEKVAKILDAGFVRVEAAREEQEALEDLEADGESFMDTVRITRG